MNITLDSGKSKRMLTGGKYCPEDVVVTAVGGNNERENGILSRTLTEYVNDEVIDIAPYSFYWYDALTSVSCANAKNARSSSFYRCTALKHINMPLLSYLSSNAFSYCSALTEVSFPSAITVDTRSLAYCPSLTKVDLAKATALSHESFRDNTAMNVLILRRTDRICKLNNITAFDGTPFAQDGTGGIVVVPSTLLEEYKIADNWNTLYGYGNCQFVQLEGSEYE